MERFGQGHCESGYYAGWDDKGLDSQDACNYVCLEEPECTYAAWYGGQTCSRYNEVDCKLKEDANHVTFKKLRLGESNSSVIIYITLNWIIIITNYFIYVLGGDSQGSSSADNSEKLGKINKNAILS